MDNRSEQQRQDDRGLLGAIAALVVIAIFGFVVISFFVGLYVIFGVDPGSYSCEGTSLLSECNP